jgi:hypothetical protein
VPNPASRLLRQLDPLPFPGRQRLLARTARQLATTSDLDVLLDELSAQDRFGRLTALQLAAIAGHQLHVRRCLDSEHIAEVRRAVPLAVRMGVAASELTDRLPGLPQGVRRDLYRALRRHGTTALADLVLPVALEHFGEFEAAAVLAACSAEVVTRHLHRLAFAVSSWGSLAHRHPIVFLDHLDGELTQTPEAAWPIVLSRLGAGLAATAPDHPDRTLAVLARTASIAGIPASLNRVIGGLARHDPRQFLEILLAPRRPGYVPGRRALWRALLGLSDDDLVRLMRVLGRAHLREFLHVVPPARRAAVYSGVIGDRDLLATGLPLEVLDQLPARARWQEARRLLALRSVAGSPTALLAVTARLPWSEAEPVLREATHGPGADERAAAYRLYVLAAAATRDADVVEQMTAALNRLANEQDPVRGAALQALADVPPWLFGSGAAARRLGGLMRDAVVARDCSWPTQRAVQTLSDRLIREGAAADEPHLLEAGLVAKQGAADHLERLSLAGLDRSLPRGAEQRVFDALRPRIVAEARHGRYTVALALAGGLRRRAWRLAPLQAFLDQARGASDDTVVRRAIELWLQPPADRDRRVARVLRDDRSTVTIGAVATAIGMRRTDLLDDVLGRPIKGRFLRGVRYLPAFRECHFARWLPRQIAAFRRSAAELAHSKKATPQERAHAVRTLGGVPDSAATVREFLTDRETQVVEAALAAMAALASEDDPEGTLPLLLAYADTDRARVAVYAATECARYVAPDRLTAPLEGLLEAGKITARKEAVRLLAENRTPACVAVIGRAWSAPDQHRDVRRAILSALRLLLTDERSWTLLREGSETEGVASAITDLAPPMIAEEHRARYAALVRTVAAATDVDVALTGLAALPRWARWDGGTSAPLLVTRYTDLANTATWRPALHALVAGCAATQSAEPALDAARLLLGAHDENDRSETFDASSDRDQPALQRIAALADHLGAAARTSSALRAAVPTLVDEIAAHPFGQDIALRLATGTIPWDQDDDALDWLRIVARLSEGTVFGDRVALLVSQSLSRGIAPLEPDQVLSLGRAVIADDAAFVALGIVEVGGRQAGWTEEWRRLLRGLRRHPDAAVRLLAGSVFTAAE